MAGNADHRTYRIIDLAAGDSIRYWQLSDVFEERFDVPDRPMQGEMDPFFFLSKHKNFIPHEYPCRMDFAKEHRGRKPTPLVECRTTRWWHPFGSNRVDLSGFWFRPTRIAAWATCTLRAETAGEIELRLTTCGAAILFLDGQEVHWTAGYQRNLEESATIRVALKAGFNELRLYFDDLAERDARFFFQLDYLAGVAVRICQPLPVDPEVAAGLEAMLDGMTFDRPAYLTGRVTILFPTPATVDIDVITDVSGDFISLEDRLRFETRLARGTTRLAVAGIDAIPADFRHFQVTLRVGDFAVSRTLGVEICHAQSQGPAPASLAARIDEALAIVSTASERGSVRALARLASGRSGAETDAMITECLPAVIDCHDCADFTLVPLLWCRIRYGEAIAAPVRKKVDAAIVEFRYWMDEPGNDVQWYFSENHALLFHTAAYLAGHLFPATRFVRSGRTGTDQAAAGAERIRAWLDHFESCEMAEWNSAPYFPIDLKGLTALAGLAPDADIADRARSAIIRLIELIARSAHQGLMTASQGRSYEHTLRAGRSLELSGLSRLLWGRGWYGGRFHCLPQLALLLRDHRFIVPETLAGVAAYQGNGGLEWCYAQGANHIAKLYHYKTRTIAMGSIAAYRWGEWGYQETVLHLRLGERPEAQIWINHPGETIQCGYGRPSYWGGCGTLPRVHQYRGLAILDFKAHPEQPDFTHAWVPTSEFDDLELAGTRLVVAAGQGKAVIIGSRPFEPVTTGPTAHCEVRLPGRDGRWIVRLDDREGPDSLADFSARFDGLTVREDGDDFVVDDPDYGRVLFHSDGRIEAEGRQLVPDAWTITGESRELPLP